MRELVRAFFKERSIVNHHIASYDDFISTMDNINSRMQRIVDGIKIDEDSEHRGMFTLDPSRTEEERIEIRIGRRRDEAAQRPLEESPQRQSRLQTRGTPVVIIEDVYQ